MRESFDIMKLVKRSLYYYRFPTVQVILAMALTTAIITGALLIGASVKQSLLASMHNRLGKVDYGIFQSDRWFKADLGKRLSSGNDSNCSAVISIPAYISSDSGQTTKITLYGVDKTFFNLAPRQSGAEVPDPGQALINRTAAIMAGLKPGESVAVRCFKPSLMPGDTAWSSTSTDSKVFRIKIAKVLSSAKFGDFNPINTQLSPANVFVDREWLAKRLGRASRANVLLTEGRPPQGISEALTLADYGLTLKKLSGGEIELKSNRVFIAPEIIDAVDKLKIPEQKIFTYFANLLTANGRMTPYSFVSGVNKAPGGIALSSRDAVVNQWLADDLKLKPGDPIGMTYYKFGPQGELQDVSAAFRVKAIIPVTNDPDLMPKFPGMSGADSCSDWDPGIPIKLNLIRSKDEAYWSKYRGTPKIFVALDTAQKLWGCRFGKITAVRFKKTSIDDLRKVFLSSLNPSDIGFSWRSLRSIGENGVKKSVDFSGLFFGLSFFVIVAGIVLLSLLYRLHLEQRSEELAVLKSMGYGNSHIRRIMLLEALIIMAFGIIIGIIAAFLYSFAIISALNTVWNDIAGSIQVMFVFDLKSILLGAGISIPVIGVVLLMSLRKFFKRDLYKSLANSDFRPGESFIHKGIAIFALLLGGFMVITGIKTGGTDVLKFFSAAIWLLVGMIGVSEMIIRFLPELLKGKGISTISIALRNNKRHLKRSMAVVIIMSLGIFLTLAVSVNRIQNQNITAPKSSGTGGFGWYIQTAIPVKGNLNSAEGKRRYRINLPPTLKIVQLPMVDGGAAGCLNLNRVSRPRLIGVPPGVFYERFSFNDSGFTWSNLQQSNSNIIPAVADMNVIKWSLGLNVGDTLDYPGNDGKMYKLQFIAGLDNSIFQGAVLVSRANLRRMFPGVSGSSILLVDQANPNMGVSLSRSLVKVGPSVESCADRLNRFNAIQNTYLMVFLSLGGIGLIIGSFGLSIILRRNLLERRSELAWLRSAGFSRSRIVFMLTAEHMIMFYCAVLTGVVAAAAAAVPSILSSTSNPPWIEMIIVVVCIWFFAVIFIASAAFSATKGGIISNLRGQNE